METLCDLALRWKPLAWAEETGQIKSGVGPFLERRLRERNAFVWRRQFPTKGDKAIRAQAIRGRMALNGLYLPSGASWVPSFRRELLMFPAGSHDDQVDAIGLIGQMLDLITPGRIPDAPKRRTPNQLLYEMRNGRLVANMSVFEWAEKRRKQRMLDA